MKPIKQDELYKHLHEFLAGRGIELKDGSYSQRIQQSCSLLTDAINLTQQGMEKAKAQVDKRLDQMRQVIHERTAPKPPPVAPASTPPPTSPSGMATPKPPGRKKPAPRSKKPRRGK